MLVTNKNRYLFVRTPAWGRRVTDVELVKESRLMDLSHYPGDPILADRRFMLVDDFAAKYGVKLIIPSFTEGKKQLTEKEVEATRQIVAIQVHIERVIGLIKNRFTILSSGTLPIPMIKSKQDEANEILIASIDKIKKTKLHTCAILASLGGSIIYNEEDTKVVEKQ